MYTLIHNDAEFLSYSKQRTTRTTSFAPKQVEKVNLRTKSVVHFKLLNRNSVGWLGFPLLTTVIDQSYRKIAIDVVNLKIQYRNFIIFTIIFIFISFIFIIKGGIARVFSTT